MYYYVIYDLNDNIIAYLDNLDDLSNYTSVRKKELKYKLKKREYIYYNDNSTFKKIYRFEV